MWGLSIWHWVIVVGVVFVLFGRNAISNTMADLGKACRELRKIPDELHGGDEHDRMG